MYDNLNIIFIYFDIIYGIISNQKNWNLCLCKSFTYIIGLYVYLITCLPIEN